MTRHFRHAAPFSPAAGNTNRLTPGRMPGVKCLMAHQNLLQLRRNHLQIDFLTLSGTTTLRAIKAAYKRF